MSDLLCNEALYLHIICDVHVLPVVPSEPLDGECREAGPQPPNGQQSQDVVTDEGWDLLSFVQQAKNLSGRSRWEEKRSGRPWGPGFRRVRGPSRATPGGENWHSA
ncbi:hypothetical protein ACFWTC_00920 [Streptomyces sp. NPDC058619]|uniref:hypothetical protein n=1 Tax=unclassified Streptomyces TaxID=2593676 RepID=UPI00366882A1